MLYIVTALSMAEALICLLEFFLCCHHRHYKYLIGVHGESTFAHKHTQIDTNSTVNSKTNKDASQHARMHTRTYAYRITYAYSILAGWIGVVYSNKVPCTAVAMTCIFLCCCIHTNTHIFHFVSFHFISFVIFCEMNDLNNNNSNKWQEKAGRMPSLQIARLHTHILKHLNMVWLKMIAITEITIIKDRS